jgi:hypothetical protein
MVSNLIELFDKDDFLLPEFLNPTFVNQVGQAQTSLVQQNAPYKLCIYYGTPAGVNNLWDPVLAGNFFAQFDLMIFGDGIELPSDPNYSQNMATFANIIQNNPNAQITGYIDLGVSTQNLTIAAITTKITQWKTTGVKGIFLDDCGYDYLTPRSRLNEVLDLIHAQGLFAIVNAWEADDVFSRAVNATYNPTGALTHIGQQDYYLLESFVYSDATYTTAAAYSTNTGYTTMSDLTYRATKALTYKAQIGCKLLSSNTFTPSKTPTFNQASIFDSVEACSLILGLDGYSLDQDQYSSVGANANQYVFYNYNQKYNTLKNDQGLAAVNYTSNSSVYTLQYKDSVFYINGITVYAVSDPKRLQALPISLNLGSTAAASLTAVLNATIFSTQKPVLISQVTNAANPVPVILSTLVAQGQLTVTATAVSGTVSGTINANILC